MLSSIRFFLLVGVVAAASPEQILRQLSTSNSTSTTASTAPQSSSSNTNTNSNSNSHSSTTGSSANSLTKITNANIHMAAREWVEHPSKARDKYGPIGEWDVSKVTDAFAYLFSTHRSPKFATFNDDITRWDTSAATNFSHIFFGNTEMDFDLNRWNTSNVVDMSSAFANTKKYRGTGIGRWDVKHVKNMSSMFLNSEAFNASSIHIWHPNDLVDASRMFSGATSFTSEHKWQSWSNTRHLQDMTQMFFHAKNFKGDLSFLNTTHVTSMKFAFFKAENVDFNVINWNVQRVKDFHATFAYATKFQGHGTSQWKTKSAKIMDGMFKRTKINQNLNNWEISTATDLRGMFRFASDMKQKVCWSLHPNAMVDGIFFQSQSHFDSTCVKKAFIEASCCHQDLDKNCQCSEDVKNDNDEVPTTSTTTSTVTSATNTNSNVQSSNNASPVNVKNQAASDSKRSAWLLAIFIGLLCVAVMMTIMIAQRLRSVKRLANKSLDPYSNDVDVVNVAVGNADEDDLYDGMTVGQSSDFSEPMSVRKKKDIGDEEPLGLKEEAAIC